MRILIAPDSFKESLTAVEAAEAMARGVRRALGDRVQIELCPMADGGEGTVEAMATATGGSLHVATVTGPLGEPVPAKWGMLGGRAGAVIEMAQAAGLHLVPPHRRDPTRTTTYGVGQLILEALDHGARRIILGIGGSATNDGGAGMAQALGIRFGGLERPMNGGDLDTIRSVDLATRDPRIGVASIVAACDVTNPLYGPEGASVIYGPQKGATPQQIEKLDAGLRRLAGLLPWADPSRPGMGAAGGLGFGLVAFCGAELARGVDLVMRAVGFEDRLKSCDLVLTGEGRLDGQSVRGKTCIGVAKAAQRHGLPVVALVGSVGPGAEQASGHGLTAYHPVVDSSGHVTLEQAMRDGAKFLEDLAAEVVGGYLTS